MSVLNNTTEREIVIMTDMLLRFIATVSMSNTPVIEGARNYIANQALVDNTISSIEREFITATLKLLDATVVEIEDHAIEAGG